MTVFSTLLCEKIHTPSNPFFQTPSNKPLQTPSHNQLQTPSNPKAAGVDNLFNDADAQRPTAIQRKTSEIGEKTNRMSEKTRNFGGPAEGVLRRVSRERDCCLQLFLIIKTKGKHETENGNNRGNRANVMEA